MRGHIRQRSPGSWEITYELPQDGSDKRRQRTQTVRGTKRDAQQELTRLLREIDTGGFVEPNRLTIGEYLERWLADYAKPNVGGKTYEVYRNHLRTQIIPPLGAIPLARLSPLDLQGLYARLRTEGRKDGRPGGLSARTILHFHRILHKALDQAVKWRLVARNVCDAVEPPRPQQQESHVLDEEQTVRLLEAAKGTQLHLPILLACATGARRGELLALKWENVDLEAGVICIRQALEQTTGSLKFKTPKTTKSRRTVVLPRFAVEALTRHRGEQAQHRLLLGPAYQDSGLVIARPNGLPVRPDNFSTEFGAFLKQHDLPHVRFHDLRHGHASQLFKAGVHVKVVRERLGHSGVGITLDTYGHVLPGMQEEAAQRLDEALLAAGSDL